MDILKPTPHIYLDELQLAELEGLSALGYPYEEIALYFNVDEKQFLAAAHDETSVIARHLKRGILASIARERLAILKSAEAGSVSASQQMITLNRHKGFKISKKEIFSGFDDMKTAREFEEWVEGGSKGKLEKEEEVYLEALSVINSMDRKYGRSKTIEHFVVKTGLKRSRVAEMYDEAMNLFNTDRNIEKKAYRNKYADLLDEVALVLKENLAGPDDAKVIGDLTVKAAALRALDKADPIPLDNRLYQKSIRYFSLDPTIVGMPAINRQLVAKQIDELQIPESDKNRVRADAMLNSIPFEEIIDELEEESRSQ